MDPIILIIPLVLFLGPTLIVLIFFRYRYLQTQARYSTLLHLADKGVELAPQMLAEPQLEYSERRRALVLIGAGLGLMVMFAALPGHFDNGLGVRSLWGLGLLPLMIGLGYLASWWLNRRGGVGG
ncbi:MAG TPA: DUF6249 domain-containing protein [Rhodanobacteraceae bacterium]|nr:DUF6249 domain-containing protein [Rhodanobacteraceae bacterium]